VFGAVGAIVALGVAVGWAHDRGRPAGRRQRR
jgi:hypothetical protein